MKQTVSVVIPCFNSQDTIARAISSVLDQTVQVLEIILIDDCSSDQTTNVVNRIINENLTSVKISLLRSPVNMGPGYARNLGLEKAEGAFVAFLDADDVWHPEKTQIQLDFFKNNQHISLSAHGSTMWEGGFQQVPNVYKKTEIRIISLLLRNTVGTRTVMMRSNVNVRFMNREFSEDYLFWLTCLQARYRLGYIYLDLACTFRPEFSVGGYSGDLLKQEVRELKTYFEFAKFKNYYYLILPFLYVYSLAKFLRRLAVRYFFK